MEKRSMASQYLEGQSLTRLIQGLIVGVIGTLIIGFAVAGWQLGGNADEKVMLADRSATVAALAPICAARFQAAAASDDSMVAELAASRAWERNTLMVDNGWATFAGMGEPNIYVADSCADLVSEHFDLKN